MGVLHICRVDILPDLLYHYYDMTEVLIQKSVISMSRHTPQGQMSQ
jgi:hypothetical protein